LLIQDKAFYSLALACVPLFLTDGFEEYTTALLAHFG